MIHRVQYTIKCDHLECENLVTFTMEPGKTIMENLRSRGWQPWGMADYCPEHRKEDE